MHTTHPPSIDDVANDHSAGLVQWDGGTEEVGGENPESCGGIHERRKATQPDKPIRLFLLVRIE